MKNIVIRKAAKSRGVKLWEIAERLDITDGNFSRKLRKELSAEDQKRILGIIEEIASTKGDGR